MDCSHHLGENESGMEYMRKPVFDKPARRKAATLGEVPES
jgi:hypothetical protein